MTVDSAAIVSWPGWIGWTPGRIRIRGPVRCGTEEFATAGWIKGAFGVDLRPRVLFWGDPLPNEACGWAWVVTHLPTGWAVCGVDGPMSMVQMLVDGLARLTDWSVINAESAVFMDARVRAYFSDYAAAVFPPSDTLGPWDNGI